MGNTLYFTNPENSIDLEKEKLLEQINTQKSIIYALKNENCVLRKRGVDNMLDEETLKTLKQCKSEHNYEYLVFSGGGIKGICFTGALGVLEELNVLYSETNGFKIKGIAGVSAGSIIASLLAVGYTPLELMDIMSKIDFEEIADDKLGYFRDTINFVENWGVCPGNYIMELMGDLIKQKTGNADYTLEDLMNDKQLKLVIVSTNMNYEKSVYLYAGNQIKEYSNIPIRVAVRMSMGIPCMFEPYEYNNNYFVDGGMLDNYPLHVFDGEYPGDIKSRLNLCSPNPKVLGLKILPDDEEKNYDIVDNNNIDGIFSYFAAFVNMFLVENERRIMTPSFWTRTIFINTPDYALTKFKITDEEMEELIISGKKCTRNFFFNELV